MSKMITGKEKLTVDKVPMLDDDDLGGRFCILYTANRNLKKALKKQKYRKKMLRGGYIKNFREIPKMIIRNKILIKAMKSEIRNRVFREFYKQSIGNSKVE